MANKHRCLSLDRNWGPPWAKLGPPGLGPTSKVLEGFSLVSDTKGVALEEAYGVGPNKDM